MALRELLATFNVDTAQAVSSLRNVDRAIDGAKGTLGALAEAFVGSALVHGLKEFVTQQIEIGSRVNDLSEKLGVGTDELQQFQFAAKLVGVESEGAAAALGFLSKNMGLAIEGNKEASEAFSKMGVALKDGSGQVRELGDVLPDVADAFEKVESSQERTALAMKIFGKQGAALIPLLKDGSGGLKAMYAEFERLGGGMSKDFIGAADKAGDEIDKLKFALQGWKSQIVFAILPALTLMITKAQTWVGGLRHVTKESRLAEVAWIALGAGGAAAGAKAAAGFAQFLGVLPKGAGFWKTALGLGEIALVAAGVVLLALVFEDLFGLMQGQESVIGLVMEKFLGAGTAAELAKQLNDSWDVIRATLATLKPDLESVSGIIGDLAKDSLPFMVGVFVDLVKLITAGVVQTVAFVSALGQLPGAIKNLDFSGIGKTFAAADERTFGPKGLLSKSSALDAIDRGAARAGAPKDVTGEIHTGGREGSRAPANVTVTNRVENNITGVKDAAGAGQAAANGTRGAIDGSLRDAFGAVGTGG